MATLALAQLPSQASAADPTFPLPVALHPAGLGWTAATPARSWARFSVSRDGQRLVAAAKGEGLAWSADGGATWLFHDDPRQWVNVVCSDDGMVVAASFTNDAGGFDNGVALSRDGGATWQVVLAHGFGYYSTLSRDGRTLASFTSFSTAQLLLSHDQGASWSLVDTGADTGLNGLASSSDGQGLYVAGALGGFRVSHDGGLTWQSGVSDQPGSWTGFITRPDDAVQLGLQYIPPTASGGVYTEHNAVVRSDDHGRTWRTASLVDRYISQWAYSTDGSRVSLLRGNGILVSADDGATWRDLPGPLSRATPDSPPYLTRVRAVRDGERWWAMAEGRPLYTTSRHQRASLTLRPAMTTASLQLTYEPQAGVSAGTTAAAPATWSVLTAPVHGSAILTPTADGVTLLYTRDSGATGSDGLDVLASAADGDSATLHVDLTLSDNAALTYPTAILAAAAPADGSAINGAVTAITVTATFSEAVSGFTAGDLALIGASGDVAPADGSGMVYTITLTPSGEGDVALTLPAGAGAGATAASLPANTLHWTRDGLPPDAPRVTSGIDPTVYLSYDTTPDLGGTAEPGALITLTEDGSVSGTAIADGAGTWTMAIAPLAFGPHAFRFTATDAAGNVSPETTIFELVQDSVVHPMVMLVQAGNVIGSADATVTATFSEPVTGFTADDLVLVGATGTVTPVDAAGTTYTITLTPTVGSEVSLYLPADAARGASGGSARSAFLSWERFASAPTIAFALAAVEQPMTALVVSGTATPGMQIALTADEMPGWTIGSAISGNDGHWTAPLMQLVPGLYHVTATATDPAGNVTTAATQLLLTVDAAPLSAPLVLPQRNPTNNPTPLLQGLAEPSSYVTISGSGYPFPLLVTSYGPSWSITCPTLAEGTYHLTATTRWSSDATRTASVDFTLVIDLTAPAAPLISDTVTTGTPAIYQVRGSAEAGATITITVDGARTATTVAAADGRWSISLPDVPAGSHLTTATATDAAGNISTPTTRRDSAPDSEATTDATADSSTGSCGLGGGVAVLLALGAGAALRRRQR